MRKAALASCLLAVALVAAPASAQTLRGTWEIESETPRGNQTMTLELVEEDGLTGTVTMRVGGRRGGGGGRGGMREIEILEGLVEGSSFSFVVTLEFNGNAFTQEFEGTFEGDEMSGTIAGPRGSRPFTGARAG